MHDSNAIELALARAASSSVPADPVARATTVAPLLRECLRRLEAAADDWIDAACAAKGIPRDSVLVAEEIAGGPIAVARALQTFVQSFTALRHGVMPPLPGPLVRRPDAPRTRAVAVLPALPFDRLVFAGYRCEVVVDDGAVQAWPIPRRGVAVVLGAGNVTAIAPTDLLTKVCRDGLPTVVKLHPVFAGLRAVLADVFAPLADVGAAFVDGDAKLGAALVADPRVTDVHLTGAAATFVGVASTVRARGARVTGELGNVTPVVVVPGAWRATDLAALVEHVASMLIQNGGYNCVAAKIVVTARAWPQRAEFVAGLRARLASIPGRRAWLPGAAERLATFGGRDDAWTFVDGLDPDGAHVCFREEAFGPVLFETGVGGDDVAAFLGAAVAFCHERLHGDLAASVFVPSDASRATRRAVDAAVAALRYGIVAVNAFPALAFAWMAAPWGAAPGNDVASPGSGIGFVHDPWFLRAPRKTVVRGPLRPWPTPPWWPAHRAPRAVMDALLRVTLRPRWWRLPRLAVAALSSRPSPSGAESR